MKYFNILRRPLSNMSQIDINRNIGEINERIKQAFLRRSAQIKTEYPCLVAVSKTKPVEQILEAYKCGQRHFGENYVQELLEKAADPRIIESCPEISWHFIGHLQKNKVKKVLSIQNLFMIQTVDSTKLADYLNNTILNSENLKKVNVLIQINTSGESEKHGVLPEEACNIFTHINENCNNLLVKGVMTIGAYGYNLANGPNPDFQVLMDVHNRISKLNFDNLVVSMGMSNDFEHAVELGSSMVRVGSSVFGERQYQNQ